METGYIAPQTEVIEIELEGTLCGSFGDKNEVEATNVQDGGYAW